MDIRVSVILAGSRITINPLPTAEPLIVPAQNLIIELEADLVPSEILLNDDPFPVILSDDRRRGHIIVDRYRSTGFNRLMWNNNVYCFGTADAKLALEGIIKMLASIRAEGLSWGGQIIFSSGATVRDARADYAWLRSIRRSMLETCAKIAAQPTSKLVKSARAGTPRGGRILTAETMALLRSNARSRLEEHPAGVVTVHGKRWMPRTVVAQSKRVTYDTPGNRRAARILLDVSQLALILFQSSELPHRQQQWVKSLLRRTQEALGWFPFSALVQAADRVQDLPAKEELTDDRYRYIFELARQLAYDRGWEPTRKVTSRYAYVSYSDEIYQAYVMMLLAAAFDARPTCNQLRPGLDMPAFQSDSWELYYDTPPPARQYKSWRDVSGRPAKLTPDYCIISRVTGRGILGDAKYRSNEGGGRLPGSALKECQVYMQHFGVPVFAVFYPGTERLIERVAGQGNTILVVSVTPFQGVAEWVRTEVRSELETLLYRGDEA